MYLGESFDLGNGHCMVWSGTHANPKTGMNWGQFELNCVLTRDEQRSAEHIASTLPETPGVQFQAVGPRGYIFLVFNSSLSAGRQVYVSGEFARRFEQEQQSHVRRRATQARMAQYDKDEENIVRRPDNKSKPQRGQGGTVVNFSHKK
ncbi:MAG TPA: hypothetical protein VFI84_00550 [Candidatus Saccharimonadales bacterium]|nr:hypothetical protein [Candidatus Saccharimonadales bacterium]